MEPLGREAAPHAYPSIINTRQNLSVRETQAVMRAQKRVALEGTGTKKDLPDDAAFELGLESSVGYDRGKRMHKNNSNF